MEPFFPEGLRPSTMEERESFYRDEFGKPHIKRLNYRWDRPVLAIDVGSETTRYRRRFKDNLGKKVYLREYNDLNDLLEKVRRYVPETLYYDTRSYDTDPRQTNSIWEKPSGKQLIFSVTPDQVECDRCDKIKSLKKGKRLAKHTFCEECFEETAEKADELRKFMKRNFDYVESFFVGREFHIHIIDNEGFEIEETHRDVMASRLSERFPIDKEFSSSRNNLTVMPGSLNGITGRKVVKVKSHEFKMPEKILFEKSKPDYLKKE